jgi:hypothetical protein
LQSVLTCSSPVSIITLQQVMSQLHVLMCTCRGPSTYQRSLAAYQLLTFTSCMHYPLLCEAIPNLLAPVLSAFADPSPFVQKCACLTLLHMLEHATAASIYWQKDIIQHAVSRVMASCDPSVFAVAAPCYLELASRLDTVDGGTTLLLEALKAVVSEAGRDGSSTQFRRPLLHCLATKLDSHRREILSMGGRCTCSQSSAFTQAGCLTFREQCEVSTSVVNHSSETICSAPTGEETSGCEGQHSSMFESKACHHAGKGEVQSKPSSSERGVTVAVGQGTNAAAANSRLHKDTKIDSMTGACRNHDSNDAVLAGPGWSTASISEEDGTAFIHCRKFSAARRVGVLEALGLQIVGLFKLLLPLMVEWMHVENAEGILLLCQVTFTCEHIYRACQMSSYNSCNSS